MSQRLVYSLVSTGGVWNMHQQPSVGVPSLLAGGEWREGLPEGG